MANVRIHPTEVREGRLELRSTDVDGASMEVEGVVTTFDDWVDVGEFAEQMSPGVFDATLSRHADDIKLLVAHNSRAIPVAKPVDWVKHPDRLVGVWEFGSHDEAVKVHRAVQEGMLTGLSVGFNPGSKDADNEWSDDGAQVRRVNARLLEVSLVATPANSGAKVTQVRSAGVPADVVRRAAGAPRLAAVRRLLDELRA
jgi:HK97 family phage prohead protease